MADIERSLVKKAFGGQAERYDSLALVQQRVIERFVSLLPLDLPAPKALLDIGAGTGRLLELLASRFPHTSLVGLDLAFGMTRQARKRFSDGLQVSLVCGDAEKLPFRDAGFDLVVSTSTYQWLTPLEPAFAEAFRVLEPGSSFCFALFGVDTLHELKDAYRTAAGMAAQPTADRTHRLPATNEVMTALERAGFRHCTLSEELETELHADVPGLLRSLKGIGAGSAARTPDSGLAGRNVMLRMMETYREKYGTPEGIPATYQILYGRGEKGGISR